MDSVFNEMNQSNFNPYINSDIYTIVYLVRLWCGRNNLYLYKVACTENFFQHINELNTRYDCDGRIIIIAAGIVTINESNLICKELEEYEVTRLLPGYFRIEHDVYRMFTHLMKNHNHFISKKYVFNESEMIYNEDKLIKLDCGENETQYWLVHQIKN